MLVTFLNMCTYPRIGERIIFPVEDLRERLEPAYARRTIGDVGKPEKSFDDLAAHELNRRLGFLFDYCDKEDVLPFGDGFEGQTEKHALFLGAAYILQFDAFGRYSGVDSALTSNMSIRGAMREYVLEAARTTPTIGRATGIAQSVQERLFEVYMQMFTGLIREGSVYAEAAACAYLFNRLCAVNCALDMRLATGGSSIRELITETK